MFKDRIQAGQLLGREIKNQLLSDKLLVKDIVVLGIPRGGVVVAGEAAKVLDCPLDVIVVKKIGAPNQEELAIGAIGETEGSVYLDERLVADLGVSEEYLKTQKSKIKTEIQRRERLYRQGRSALDLKDKTVIIVDDGAATGATVIAACREVWNNNPKKVMVALPVVAKDTLAKLEEEADEVIFLDAPEMFFAVGQFYEEFDQITDQTVIKILSSKF